MQAQHEVLLHGKNGLAIVNKAGETTWQMPFGGIHDIHVLENGNIMVQRNMHEIVEIDRQRTKIDRSEERQEGQEGRTRWSPYQ